MKRSSRRVLPEAFCQAMRRDFSRFGREEETERFLRALSDQAVSALRANTLKINRDDLRRELVSWLGKSDACFPEVPWADDGLYYPEACVPGALAAHQAGLFYIQESSAMLPARMLGASPDERVLDLCAAPGGKSGRIAADLDGRGLIWANEIAVDRAPALRFNLERLGVRNAIVSQDSPERLAASYPGVFDAILVDAPCSGSGMFRKDPGAIAAWERYGVEPSRALQELILEQAWKMLRPGGRLVYATCSFSIEENEAQVAAFLGRHEDAELSDPIRPPGVDPGWPLTSVTARCWRIWPHRASGEGHFCALLRRSGCSQAPTRQAWPESVGGADTHALEVLRSWARLQLTAAGCDRFNEDLAAIFPRLHENRLHLMPSASSDMPAGHRIKTGLIAGELRRRPGGEPDFVPAQSWLAALRASDPVRILPVAEGDPLLDAYRRGETLQHPSPDDWSWARGGWAACCLAGVNGRWPLGWLRLTDRPMLKNLYPPGWRIG